MNKHYIGDGVYIRISEREILLTTENGINITNVIVLESDVLDNMLEYISRCVDAGELRLRHKIGN